MTNGNPMDALAGLLDERRRYEGWLAQLEARRTASPSHVVDRVRQDYLDRLRGVTDLLRGRAAELEATVAEMAGRIAALLADETQRRDERAETELRALVGEYSEEHASGALAGFDHAIGQLVEERSALGVELARLQEVLALVNPPAPAPTIVPVRAPAPEEPAASPAAPAPAAASGFDELAFLKSVVQPRESAPLGSQPSPDRLQHGGDYLPPPTLTTVRRSGGGEEMVRDHHMVDGGAQAAEAVAAFFKDVPTEQVKTLKCAECGTMNYPTEWYCERCGGELAAM